MSVGKLSDTACRNAKARDKGYKLTDGGGMHLLVQPTGAKLWRLAYRFGGKQKTLSFGSYPTITLAGARQQRDDARKKIELGIDPAVEQAEQDVTATTFKTVAEAWKAVWEVGKDDATVARRWAQLEVNAFPVIGHKPVGEIEAPDIVEVVRKMENRKAVYSGRRVKGLCSMVFQYAIAVGLAKYDPTVSIARALKPVPVVQHHRKLPVSKLPEMLGRLGRDDMLDQITKGALKFTLLTWVRTSETRFARWPEFEGLDGAEPLWRLSPERMKMDREHLVPLPPQAVEILKVLPRSKNNDFVFWSRQTKSGVISENTMLFAMYRLGYERTATIHGLRGVASTWANEALMPGCDPLFPVRRYHQDWIERQLAHVEESEVREAYNAAEYLAPRRQMMKDWGNLIEIEEAAGLLLG